MAPARTPVRMVVIAAVPAAARLRIRTVSLRMVSQRIR